MSKIAPLETSNSISDYEDEDTISVAASECSRNGQVILAEDVQQENPTFGNIAVTNSTDIHFGNKTYYQGPVTIKQVLYANSKNSESDGETVVSSNFASENPGFVADQFGAKVKVDDGDKVNVTETRQRKGTRWLQRFSRQHVILITSLAIVLLMSLITLMVVLMSRHDTTGNRPQYPKDSDEQDSGVPPDYPVDSVENSTLASEFRLISRNEWLADPPKPGVEVLKIPVPYVIIMHTASAPCSNEEVCKKMVKDVQVFHAEGRGWSDIGYSFLVGGDGNAYEGRGWYNVGAQVFGYNNPSVNLTLPPKLKIIPRSEWLAQPPIEQLSDLVHPIPYVVISHTATDNCSEQAICKIRIRDLQSFQIEGKGLWDIAYNFLVGGDGYAYEGRGWNYEGAHTFGYNSKSIGIAFIGTFHRVKPPPYQILAAKQLIEKGIESGVLSKNYRLFGEKQLQDTLSPGAMLYEEIMTWPKWKNGTLFP